MSMRPRTAGGYREAKPLARIWRQWSNIGVSYHSFMHENVSPDRAKELERYGHNGNDPHFKLRDVFQNVDLFDTLTPDAVKLLMNPPSEYSAEYQKKVNEIVLTALATLKNLANMPRGSNNLFGAP